MMLRVTAVDCCVQDVARYLFQQLVAGLEWCHSKVGALH